MTQCIADENAPDDDVKASAARGSCVCEVYPSVKRVGVNFEWCYRGREEGIM